MVGQSLPPASPDHSGRLRTNSPIGPGEFATKAFATATDQTPLNALPCNESRSSVERRDRKAILGRMVTAPVREP